MTQEEARAWEKHVERSLDYGLILQIVMHQECVLLEIAIIGPNICVNIWRYICCATVIKRKGVIYDLCVYLIEGDVFAIQRIVLYQIFTVA